MRKKGGIAENMHFWGKFVPEVGIEPTWACGPRDFESNDHISG